MDKVNNQELLKFILDSIEMIKKRFVGIASSDEKLEDLENKVSILLDNLKQK